MPLPPLAAATSASEWSYIAEGGANLVCSFSGPADSPYSGRALRPSSSSSSFAPAEPTLKVIDLDPKPLSRLGKYWRMDQSIVRRWGEMLDGLSEGERAKVRVCGDREMKVWRGGDLDGTE